MKPLFRVLIAVLIAVALAGAKSKAPVKPTKVYVLPGCSSCVALTQSLASAGVKLTVTATSSVPYDSYPRVIYSDGIADSGSRIYEGRVSLPKKLSVVSCNSGG